MIVKMQHLDLVCLAEEKDKTLTQLRDLGVVHLDFASAQSATVTAAKGAAADAENAVRLILKARGKEKDINIHERSVADVLEIDADRGTLKSAKDELERMIRTYEPYGDFDPELAEQLLKDVEGLRDVVPLPETLPPMRLSKMYEKLDRVENRITIDTAKLAGTDEKAILKKFPALADKIAFESAKEIVGEQGELAYVSGWIPVTKVEGFRAEAAKCGWGSLLRDPVEGETPPTLVEPPKLFRSMKALFDGLGIAPAYTESDVSVPFMCYFSLFFAMLVGDGAYGAIIFILTMFGWRKYRAGGGAHGPSGVVMRDWLVLLTVFSLATIGWGVLTNTWFGAGIPCLANLPTVKWLGDPTYNNMMLLCFTIGASHLIMARLWNGICQINSLSCIAEFGWAGVLLFMYFVVNAIIGIFPSVPSWSYWLFGVSAVLVASRTRGSALGMLPLNIMGAMGDIISYVRLFAVGYASLQVAQNFNRMAIELDLPIWAKVVPMVLILLIGHGMNFMLAGLAVLVHAVRLNTLEFSNHKGITWSGREFRPFRRN